MKNIRKKFILTFLSLFTFTSFVYSQDSNNTNGKADINDTLLIYSPNQHFGTFPSWLIHKGITKFDIVKYDALSPYEIIERKTSHKFLGFGTLGYSPLLNDYGIISNPSLMQGTISHSVLPYSFSSFEFFPLLLVDKIEVLSGSVAQILSKTSNGLVLNFKPRFFNTKFPYTQIWIGQGGYEYLGSSGIFAQNVARNFNFFFAYQRYWSAGRYSNANSDRWSISSGISWFGAPRLNFRINYLYTNLNNNLYGGINPKKSEILFDNTFSTVNYENLNKGIYQHELALNYFYFVTFDSSIYSDGGFRFAFSKQNFEFENFFADYFNVDKNSSNVSNEFVFNSKFTICKPQYKILLGTEIEKPNQNKWLFIEQRKEFLPNVYTIFNKNFGNYAEIQFGARISTSSKSTDYALGSNFKLNFDTSSKFYFDLSFSKKNSFNIFENSQLLIVGYQNIDERISFSSEVYARNIKSFSFYDYESDSVGNIVSFKILQKRPLKVMGANFLSNLYIVKPLQFTSKANLIFFLADNTALDWLPQLILSVNLAYRFVRGSSYLDLGLEFELFSPFKGLYFHPLYNFPIEFENKRQWQTNGLNVFASAKLGNAFVNLSIRNIISANYYLLPIYPEYDRNIRITVFFSFND